MPTTSMLFTQSKTIFLGTVVVELTICSYKDRKGTEVHTEKEDVMAKPAYLVFTKNVGPQSSTRVGPAASASL